MLISVNIDRYGCLHARPVNEKTRRAIAKHVARFEPTADGTLFVQDNIQDTLDTFCLSRSQIRDLDDGWPLRIRVDNWTYLSMVGHDANTMPIAYR